MRTIRVALFELAAAVRTRRAIVLVALYLAWSLLGMSGAITALGKMEDRLAEILQVEKVEGKSGVVSAALWKSKPFQQLVRSVVGDSLIYDDIVGKHPAELIYAWIVFLSVPLLTVLVATRRVAEEVKSGAAKYMLLRVTRLEWTLGKYLGIALLMLVGLLIGAVAAWIVAAFRLSGADIPALLPAMVVWSVKAWFLSLAWLGLALGVSHLFKSGAKADAVAILLMIAFSVVPAILKGFGSAWLGGKLLVLVRLFPSSVDAALWRSSFLPVAASATWLVMLGLLYLSVGHAVFARRDVR
ncbi:MAG: ABC transporter permease [Kiritimatiellae bacterium]|nr:ABC transporter permease [Kiritimatiellia bacterium]